MDVEILNVNGVQLAHTVVPIKKDGACLFGAISYFIYGDQSFSQDIREEIVQHVVNNWEKFGGFTFNSDEQTYSSANEYLSEMSLSSTFGSMCELHIAELLYNINFEVYKNCVLYYSSSLNHQGYPVKRLKFTGNINFGHFDVYTQEIISPSSSRKCRARFTNNTRKKQQKEAAKKYVKNHPKVHRTAKATYQRNNPDQHRADVASYQENHPEVRRTSKRIYQQHNPDQHRAEVASYQKTHPDVHRTSKRIYQQHNPDQHRAEVASYQESHPEVHKIAQSEYRERQTLQWKVKENAAMQYNRNINYENDTSISLGKMSHKCKYCCALKWKDESAGLCCNGGKVQLQPLQIPPEPIFCLITDNHPEHKHFIDSIRKYNGCFQMTSFGAKQVIESGFMPTFKVQGQVYHLVGSLLPAQEDPKFLQIYFVGGEEEDEAALRCNNFPGIKKDLVIQLQRMLHEVNPYIKDLKTTMQRAPQPCDNYQIVIHADQQPTGGHPGRFNAPTCHEVALVIVGQQFESRDIVLQSHDNKLRRISELHRSYDALQYPLIFCHGENGYAINIPLIDPVTKQSLQKKTVSAASFYAYRIMWRQDETNHIFHFRSLFSQFLVDMYAKIETERLNYIRNHQKELRSENYIHLRDAVGRQDANAADLGRLMVLPSSFTGGPRYMHERTQDAMTYVRHYGRPDLFITFTCNSKWPEITDALIPLQKAHDRHDIIARVFHLKVKKLMALLTKGNIFGKTRCFMYSVEWQKRGLPHIHILLWLDKRISSNMIDTVVCAEIPDPVKDPLLHEIVKKNMIHGPCGSLNAKSPCMINGSCCKNFPKALINETQTGVDGYPKYRRKSPNDGGFTVKLKGIELDNRWVVPYNPVLLRTVGAHSNVEICSSVKSIKYICKYVNKGSDQASFALESEKDEIKIYESGRYISSSEAVWRILAFPIHERYPPVFHLDVHLENGQRVYFTAYNLMDRVTNTPNTTLLAFFELCTNDDFAKTLLYCEVPSYYVLKKKSFERRKKGILVDGWPNVKRDNVLGRVYTIHPNNAECYYLRMLLHVVRGPTSFEYLKTVNNELHPTFQSACLALGLLEDDKHWDSTLEEATLTNHPFQLRELFTVMLVNCHLSNALNLWEKHKNSLSEDITRRLVRELQDEELKITDVTYNKCLMLIEDSVLSVGGKTLSYYGLPTPIRSENILQNREYLMETNYDVNILAREVVITEKTLTNEQQIVYDEVISSIETGDGKLFFLDAPGGTGKTFILNLLLSKVRSQGSIALAVATSGIAATLLEGGKTAHSTFKLPLNLIHTETPVCNISKQSNLAQVLKDCKLIVWDESTMGHKGAFEALSRTLQDIRTNNNSVMGGITVLLAGDFRQTLPIVPRGTRADQVKACLKSSYLWQLTLKLSLHTNMRVHLRGDSSAAQFSKTLLEIGDGKYPEDKGKVIIPPELGVVVKTQTDLTSKIYPDIVNINIKSNDWLCERAILTPTNDRAAIINDALLKSFNSPEMQYNSIDTVLQTEEAVHYPVEFLNSLNPPGFPPHKLVLKIGAPIMLLRNFKAPKLCNGTRLRVKALHKNVIEAIILTGCGKGESVFIPRIPLIPTDYAFEFKRLQFPLKVSFAITINKSQGQSLKVAGVDLSEDCFSHGQFYVACSRVSSSKNLYILANDGKTDNIVYKEVLR